MFSYFTQFFMLISSLVLIRCKCSCSPAGGSAFVPASAAGHRSHYHNNEIIMNAAARLHQRNIYCIIYSVPWFREKTYKLPAMLFPMHTLSSLPFKAVDTAAVSLCVSRPWDALLGRWIWRATMADPNSLSKDYCSLHSTSWKTFIHQ